MHSIRCILLHIYRPINHHIDIINEITVYRQFYVVFRRLVFFFLINYFCIVLSDVFCGINQIKRELTQINK